MPVDLSVICNSNMKTVEYSHLGDYFRTNYYIFLKKESRKWYFYPVEKTEEKMIITEATYTDSGNFLKTLKDEVGAVTNYSYDEKKGTLQSVTDANGNATSYTYNEKNNVLTSVTAGGMKNNYSYSKDMQIGRAHV